MICKRSLVCLEISKNNLKQIYEAAQAQLLQLEICLKIL